MVAPNQFDAYNEPFVMILLQVLMLSNSRYSNPERNLDVQCTDEKYVNYYAGRGLFAVQMCLYLLALSLVLLTRYSHVIISMNPFITHGLSNSRKLLPHSRRRPLILPTQRSNTQRIESLGHDQIVPPPDFLLMWITRPRIVRRSDDSFPDFREALLL
jgi:hypothetical protein